MGRCPDRILVSRDDLEVDVSSEGIADLQRCAQRENAVRRNPLKLDRTTQGMAPHVTEASIQELYDHDGRSEHVMDESASSADQKLDHFVALALQVRCEAINRAGSRS